MNERLLDDWLMCEVLRFQYDNQTKCGIVHIRKEHCTDMKGTIELFTMIDPEVKFIEVLAGGRPDIIYARLKDGTWKPLLMNRALQRALEVVGI